MRTSIRTAMEREVDRALATVMFTDIVSSTERAFELGDARWRALLERHCGLSRKRVAECGGRAVKATGDGYFAIFDAPTRAVRCASVLAADVQELGIELRAGLHTGEVELIGDDAGGIAVHIGARISTLGGAGQVLASSTVRDLVMGSGIEFGDHGRHELKGIPGKGWIFRLESVPVAAPRRRAASLSSSLTGSIPRFSVDTGAA
jgi:class 3 adenylate cyclase